LASVKNMTNVQASSKLMKDTNLRTSVKRKGAFSFC